VAINYNAVGNNGYIASITNGVASGLSENCGYDMLERGGSPLGNSPFTPH
jgi:hypothetical protein